MTVFIIVGAILLLCVCASAVWFWAAHRKPIDAMDHQLAAVDEELTATRAANRADAEAANVRADQVAMRIPEQRTTSGPQAVRSPDTADL